MERISLEWINYLEDEEEAEKKICHNREE